MRRLPVLGAALAIALCIGVARAAAPVTLTPGQLTVGVAMPSEAFQVGAVRGSEVVLARGFEIDLARALAVKLGLARTVFVQSRFDRLFSAGTKPFDLAIAEITVTDRRRQTVEFSRPYMSVGQGVLVSTGLATVPRSIAALKQLRLCALAKSTGADLVRDRIAPTTAARFEGNVPQMLLDLQSGRCDAVVYDAPPLAVLQSRAPARYGPFAGVIDTGEDYGIALQRGSTLLAPVDKALASLIADGTVDRLQRKWIKVDLDSLPALR
jgi:polar amino acid transport system substrate-binding protein